MHASPHSITANPRVDAAMAILLGLAAAGLYAVFALRIAQGQFLDYFNLAFDFDPTRYVDLMARPEYERGGVKHPLVLLLRPFAWPALALGATPPEAASLVMALFGGATVAVVYLFLRRIGTARPEASALSVLFAVSGSQFVTAMITEAYGPAGFAIACVWLVAAIRLADPARARIALFATAVLTYGITTTNLLQTLIAEGLVQLRHRGLAGAVRSMIRFGLLLAALLAVLSVLVWHDVLLELLADPVAALKQAYWQRTKGEKLGVVDTVWRLSAYGVVSPDFTIVDLPGGIAMWDFRAAVFPGASLAAAVLWLVFWLVGTAAFIANPRTRWLAFGMLAALLANIVLHLDFQYRGSLYLYTGHVHFLLFALGCGAAPLHTRHGVRRGLYLATVLALVALVGTTTLDRAARLATGFDTVKVDCDAPCD